MDTRTIISQEATETNIDDNHFVCCECEQIHHVRNRVLNDDYFEYCRHCYSDKYVTCEFCGKEIARGGNDHYSCGDDVLCERCYSDNVVLCACCDDPIYIGDANRQDGEYYCDDCFNSNFSYCERCDEYFPSDNVSYDEETDTHLCDDCMDVILAERGAQLHEYSFKPRAIFHHINEITRLYLGGELEFSFGNDRVRKETLREIGEILEREETDFYFKKDGSLNVGFEMVSHPMTLSYWKKLKPVLTRIFGVVSKNVIVDRIDDGLHIHVSRKNMSDIHKKRFECFFDMCQEQILIFARRENNGYFEFGSFPKNGKIAEQKGTYNNDRYKTVNWQNSATVEIRCFKSTTSILEFYACLELVHAIYQFTKHCSIIDVVDNNENCKVWTKFINFIRGDKRYQNAYRYWLIETSH